MFADPYFDCSSGPFFRVPTWASHLANLYLRLRSARGWDQAKRRKFYRYIAAERDYLVSAGVSAEALRRLCRYLSDPRDERRLRPVLEMKSSLDAPFKFDPSGEFFQALFCRDRSSLSLPCDRVQVVAEKYRPISLVKTIQRVADRINSESV